MRQFHLQESLRSLIQRLKPVVSCVRVFLEIIRNGLNIFLQLSILKVTMRQSSLKSSFNFIAKIFSVVMWKIIADNVIRNLLRCASSRLHKKLQMRSLIVNRAEKRRRTRQIDGSWSQLIVGELPRWAWDSESAEWNFQNFIFQDCVIFHLVVFCCRSSKSACNLPCKL